VRTSPERYQPSLLQSYFSLKANAAILPVSFIRRPSTAGLAFLSEIFRRHITDGRTGHSPHSYRQIFNTVSPPRSPSIKLVKRIKTSLTIENIVAMEPLRHNPGHSHHSGPFVPTKSGLTDNQVCHAQRQAQAVPHSVQVVIKLIALAVAASIIGVLPTSHPCGS